MNPEKTLLQNKEAEPRYSLVSEHVPGIYKALSKSSVLKRTTTTKKKMSTKSKRTNGRGRVPFGENPDCVEKESRPQIYPVFPHR